MGEPHPDNLVFYRYKDGKEKWVTHKWLQEYRLRANESNRKHYKKEKAYYVAKAQARRKNTQNIDLSDFNKEKIKKIYRTAKHKHVDHIFALIHPHFCGLHVPWNLQVLPVMKNLSKGNKVEVGYFNILGDETLRFEEKRV